MDEAERLIKLLRNSDWAVQEKAVYALCEIGEPAVEPLLELLRDEDFDVRYSAAEALGQIGDARAVEPLISMLGDEHTDIRYFAAEALGQIGDARAVEPLIRMLGDEEWYVCSSAAEALGKIGESAVEPLILSLWDDNEDVLKSVSTVLNAIDPDWVTRESTRKYLPYFTEALQKGTTPVKLYMIGILEKMGDPSVSELIMQTFKDRDKSVRLRAAKALDEIKKKSAF